MRTSVAREQLPDSKGTISVQTPYTTAKVDCSISLTQETEKRYLQIYFIKYSSLCKSML